MNNYSLHFTKFQNTSEYTDDVGLIGLDLELLNSINQKLSLLDLLRKDIGEMKSDLESTQNQITLLRMDNRTIKGILSMLYQAEKKACHFLANIKPHAACVSYRARNCRCKDKTSSLQGKAENSKTRY